jgi:serine/threonine-protein kinase
LKTRRFAVLLLKNGLLAGALLLTAGLSALTTMRVVLTSQEVVVPSLVERRISEAGTIAARHSLLLRIEGKRHDPRVPVDRIVAQDPAAGATLKTHRSVRVWLSQGPRRITIPAVEGESLRTARLTLEQSRLAVARVVEVDDASAEGTVVVQRPPAGETDGAVDGVSLLVSRGPTAADHVMPDLIGRDAQQVLDGLRVAGLKVGDVRYRSYPGVAAGIVLRQLPAAGHRVSPRTPVNLEVSRDPR